MVNEGGVACRCVDGLRQYGVELINASRVGYRDFLTTVVNSAAPGVD
jgi:hypothetical protein